MKIFRNKWVEFSPGVDGINLRVSLGGYFDSRPMLSFCPGWGRLFVHLPFRTKYDECEPPQHGFYYHGNALVWCWRRKHYFMYMPWDQDWVRTSRLLLDYSWEHETKGHRVENWNHRERYWSEDYPYRYTLHTGEVQERVATVTVEEREWRPRWFKWTRLFAKVRRTIAIEFSEEVGERTGSWKGGVLGCGYDMLAGEKPEQALRRMEAERKFK